MHLTTPLSRSDFEYELPEQLIAQEALNDRSASRLLLLQGSQHAHQDLRMRDLPQLLRRGDLLVFNDTRVLPARLLARKQTGGRIELLLERALPDRRALVQLRDSKSVKAGTTLESAGGPVHILRRQEPFWEIELPQETVAFFENHGQVPLPPYIERAPTAADRERYQSLLARVPGAVAAPTASLHFDEALLGALSAQGIERTTVTLHVGAATFQPLRSESLLEHRMHSERYSVPDSTVDAIARVRASGHRVVAVGTTVARALESAALRSGSSDHRIASGEADTTLFIHPGFQFQVIDALLTNFHLPGSTLLMLVAAFAGRDAVLAAYRHAVASQYRFFSYGDAMLVFP